MLRSPYASRPIRFFPSARRVLRVVYLIFTEGYAPTGGGRGVRGEL